MAENDWARDLDLEGKNARVLGAGHQILFSCQHPSVPYPLVQIVHSGGNIYGVRVLPIIVPEDALVSVGATCLKIIHDVGPDRCSIVFVHEVRPYPALLKDRPGDTLFNLPGGVVTQDDVSLAGGGIREFLEELGADPKAIVAQMPLLAVPAPASAGAQVEGMSLHCLIYRGKTEFRVAHGEGVSSFELVPLVSAYHVAKKIHEEKKECVDLKVFLMLLMLQQEYLEAYGVPLYAPL